MGCACALELARAGLGVALLERGPGLGREASSAAAGMLAPQMEGAEGLLAPPGAPRDALLGLCLAGRALYPEWVRRVEAESGAAVHYRSEGTLVVALDVDEAVRLQGVADRQTRDGLRAAWLDAPRARRLEPALATELVGALHLPDDHQVDNAALTAAVAWLVSTHPRVEVRLDAPVEEVEARGGAVSGVRGPAGRVAAARVVVAAGAWSGRMAGLPRALPVRPVKGQMAALAPDRDVLARTVAGPGAYLVPRVDGRILVGATVEEAGFDVTVEPSRVALLAAAARRLVPALAGSRLVRRWAGLRPGTPDGLPFLGWDPDLPGLAYATGHYRNGILLAPVTAALVAALLSGGSPPVDPAPFRPDRPAPREPGPET